TWANTWSAPSFVAVPLLPRPPVAVLTSPSPTTYSAGTAVTLTAEIAQMDGSIARVEFYDGPILLTTLLTAPWTTTSFFSPGTHSVYAIAYAPFRSGATTPVTFTMSGTGSGEKIAITSPVAEQHFYAGANVTLTANVTDPSGTVSAVYFYSRPNNPPIATLTHAPWTTTWANVAGGDSSPTP